MWYLPKCSRGTPREGYGRAVVRDVLLEPAQALEKYKVINTTENLKRTELVHMWINNKSLREAWREEQRLSEEKDDLINLLQFFDPVTALVNNIGSTDTAILAASIWHLSTEVLKGTKLPWGWSHRLLIFQKIKGKNKR